MAHMNKPACGGGKRNGGPRSRAPRDRKAPRTSTSQCSGGDRPAYEGVNLSAFFDGRSGDDLSLHRPRSVSGARIPSAARRAHRRRRSPTKTVVARSGLSVPYDKLILATGSYPFVPSIRLRLPGCFVYRTIEISKRSRLVVGARRTGVVIGGGLLARGANALRIWVSRSTSSSSSPTDGAAVDEAGGAILRRRSRESGSHGAHARSTTELGARIDLRDDGRDPAVVFRRQHAAADIVVFSAGIRPRDELARATGWRSHRGAEWSSTSAAARRIPTSWQSASASYEGRTFGLVAPGTHGQGRARDADGRRRCLHGFRHEHEAEAAAATWQLRDAFATTLCAHVLSAFDTTRRFTRSWCSARTAATAGRHPGRRRRPVRSALQWCKVRSPAPAPEELIFPRGGATEASRRPGVDWLPDGASLFLQQRRQGQHLSGHRGRNPERACPEELYESGYRCGSCVTLLAIC